MDGGSGGAAAGSATGGSAAGAGSLGGSTNTAATGSTSSVVTTAGNTGSSASLDELFLAAVITGSCVPEDGISRTLARFYEPGLNTGMWAGYPSQAACLVAIGGGCHAASECLGYALTANPSCAESDGVVCDGSVMAACEDGYQYNVECGFGDYVCQEGAGCIQDEAEPCDEDTYTPSCSAEGRPTSCRAGYVQKGPLCSSLGLECSGVCSPSMALSTSSSRVNLRRLRVAGISNRLKMRRSWLELSTSPK